MRTTVIDRQREAMVREGLDALIAISPENFAYTTGFVVPSQPLMRWRHNAAVVTRTATALLAVDMEATTVRSKAPGVEVRVWGEFTDSPMAVLARLLQDLGVAGGAIGLEMDYLPAGDFARLRELLPGARFVPAEKLYDRLRQLKTPEELDILRRLSRIADESIAEAYASVQAGMTEMDLAAALTKGIYARGAEYFKLMIVASGERSEYPNVGPTHRALQRGDLCRVEIFPIIAGYHAGVCRTAVVQEASAQAERIWRVLTECKHIVFAMLRPGASSRAIYEAFLKKFGELGLPPISFVGHGIGLHLHEEPYLGKYSDARLEAGMVLGIEPLVYAAGMGFGLQNKDMVAVTPGGFELLSDRTNTDRLIVVEGQALTS
jgi:Xaa-Pro aminopeptidase